MFGALKYYVIALDGRYYGLSGNRIEPIDDVKDINRAFILVNDMQEAVSRTMTVEAPVKYAEHVVRKQLHMAGDFDEPVSIITHWKKKKAKNMTDIFFSAIPVRLYNAYLDQIRDHEEPVMMVPLYAVLFNVLQHIRSDQASAVVFQHHRYAELIIGNRQTIRYAGRCVAFDESKEQISTLPDAVETEIAMVEQDFRIKVDQVLWLNWIDGGDSTPQHGESKRPVFAVEREAVSFNGRTYDLSFPWAVKNHSAKGVVSPAMERFYYYARKSTVFLNLFLFLLLSAVVGGWWWYKNQPPLVMEDPAEGRRHKQAVQAPIGANLPDVKDYKGTVSFVKDLLYYRKAPSYRQVLKDVADALSPDMETEVLKADYVAGRLTLELFGLINQPFEEAHQGYRGFMEYMKSKGYTVREHRFDTEIKTSRFLVTFVKAIG